MTPYLPYLIGMNREQLLNDFTQLYPELTEVLQTAREVIGTMKVKREIYPYQAAVLYALAKQYDFPGARCLEIGSAVGYSGAVLAMAMPQAEIITLNPKEGEMELAAQHLSRWGNVKVLKQASQDFLITAGEYEFIFVDGDHKRIQEDLGYLLHVANGGMIVFHDYTPAEATERQCPPVYEALNRVCHRLLQRELDVVVVDNQQVGLAGIRVIWEEKDR